MGDDPVPAPVLVGEVVAKDNPVPVPRGRFVKGDPRINYAGTNHGGRKSGSKSRLSNAFVLDLIKWHTRYGYKAIERVGKENPTALLQMIASVASREVKVDVEHSGAVALGVVDIQDIKQRTRELFARLNDQVDTGSREE